MFRKPFILAGACSLALLGGTAAVTSSLGGSSAVAADHPRQAAPAAAAQKDVVDTAVAAGQFKTLAAALKAAGLVETLKGEGPFTVFAPTDEAFAALPEGTVEKLLKPENKQKLTAILTYHVVPARATSSDVAGMSSAKTVQGGEVRLRTDAGKVTVDDATVTKADVMASNGVIHVIDKVLMPKE
jgi:uncharacterized surface protein with fasciclin (FAS1) repeats